jgi:hypothetical protein
MTSWSDRSGCAFDFVEGLRDGDPPRRFGQSKGEPRVWYSHC